MKQHRKASEYVRERYGEDFAPPEKAGGISPVEISVMKNWKKVDRIKNHSCMSDPTLVLGRCVYIALDENSKIRELTLFLYKDGRMMIWINANFTLNPIKSEFETALKQQGLVDSISTGFDHLTPCNFRLLGTKEEMAKLLLALKLFQTTLDEEFIRDVSNELGGLEYFLYPIATKHNQNFGLAGQIAASSSNSPVFTTRPSSSATSETTIKQETNRSPSPQG
jgi:hypothetical protein